MVIDAIGPCLNALRRGGVGILLDKRRTFSDRLLHCGIRDDVSGEGDIGFQKLPSDGADAFMDLLGFIPIFDHVDHDADFSGGAATDEDFHDGISVGDGGGLRRGDDDDVVGAAGEGEDVAADACAGVDDEDIGIFADCIEVVDDAFAVGFDEVGHLGETGGTGDQRETGGDGGDDFGQGALAGYDMREVETGLHIAKDVGIGEAEVGIQQNNTPAHSRQNSGEIHGEVGFSDAAFTGGDGNGLGAWG